MNIAIIVFYVVIIGAMMYFMAIKATEEGTEASAGTYGFYGNR